MSTKTEKDQEFDDGIAKALEDPTLEDYERSALILQRMIHRDWTAWIAMHADGTMGGGITACKAAAEICGTMLAELAINLTKPGKDPLVTARTMLEWTIQQCKGSIEAQLAGESHPCDPGVTYDFSEKPTKGLN